MNAERLASVLIRALADFIEMRGVSRLPKRGWQRSEPELEEMGNMERSGAGSTQATQVTQTTQAAQASPPPSPSASSGFESQGFESRTSKSAVDPEKTRIYTNRQAIKHIIAVEDHLSVPGTDELENICIPCLEEKHLPALEMYTQEGKSYCKGECDAYKKLEEAVKKVRLAIRSGDIEKTDVRDALVQELRSVRKQLAPSERFVEEVKKLEGE